MSNGTFSSVTEQVTECLRQGIIEGRWRETLPGRKTLAAKLGCSQGTVEEANVDISNEMLRMIQAQQAYNGNARALQTGSEMLRSAIETLMRG